MVGVDGRTSEDLENARLKEYAKASGPAGAGMADGEEGKSLTDMAKEYGQDIMDVGSDVLTTDLILGAIPFQAFNMSVGVSHQ